MVRRTVLSTFVGPLRPDTVRLPPKEGEPGFIGPVRPEFVGGRAPTPTGVSIEEQTRVQEEAQKRQEAIRLQEERKQRIAEERQRFRSNLRNIKGLQERQQAQRDLNKRIAEIQRQERQAKQQAGITTPTIATLTREQSEITREIRGEAERRGVDVSTPAREMQFLSQLRKKAGRQQAIEGKDIELRKEAGIIERGKQIYFKAEQLAREKITYPISERIYKKTGLTKEEFAEIGKEISYRQTSPIGISGFWAPKKIIELEKEHPLLKAKVEAEAGYFVESLESIKEKPVKTLLWYGGGVVVPPTIAGVGWGARALKITKIPGVMPTIKFLGTTIKYGAPIIYAGIKGQEIISAPTPYEKGRIIGEAVTTEIAPMIAGSVFGSKLATRVASKEMISNQLKELSPKDRIKFENYMEDIKQLQKEGTVPVKEVNLRGMDRLPPQARDKTIKYLKTISKKGDILGGSIAGRTQTYGMRRSYATSDLDLYTKGSPYERALAYANVLKNAGIQRVSVVPGTGRVTIGGEKVAEWHDMTSYAQNIYQAEKWWKPVKTTYTKSPEGINVMKIQTQVKRKLIGSYLQGRYEKDYPDFKKILKSMYEKTYIEPTKPSRDIMGLKPPTPREYKYPYYYEVSPTFKPSVYSYAKQIKPTKYIPLITIEKFTAPPYSPTKKEPLRITPPPKPTKETIPLIKITPYTKPEEITKPTPLIKTDKKLYMKTSAPSPKVLITGKGERRKRETKTSKGKGFDLGIVVKNKPKIIERGLSLEDARDLGAKRVLKDLRATFFIKEGESELVDRKTEREFLQFRKKFRPPVEKSRLKDLGDEVWIQKKSGSGGRLFSGGELSEIQQALTKIKKNPRIIDNIKSNQRLKNELNNMMINKRANNNPNSPSNSKDMFSNKRNSRKKLKKNNPQNNFNFLKKASNNLFKNTKKKSKRSIKKINWFS